MITKDNFNLLFDDARIYLYGKGIIKKCRQCKKKKEFYTRRKNHAIVATGAICKDCQKEKNKHEYRRKNN